MSQFDRANIFALVEIRRDQNPEAGWQDMRTRDGYTLRPDAVAVTCDGARAWSVTVTGHRVHKSGRVGRNRILRESWACEKPGELGINDDAPPPKWVMDAVRFAEYLASLQLERAGTAPADGPVA